MKLLSTILGLLFLNSIVFIGCKKTEPVAIFSFDGTPKPAPVTIQFNNTSTDADEYLWDFGDGGVSTEQSPKHQYKAAGTYSISLVAKNKKKDSNTMTKQITVLSPLSVANVTKITVKSFTYPAAFNGPMHFKLKSIYLGKLGISEIPGSLSASVPLTPLASAGYIDCYFLDFSGFQSDIITTSFVPSEYVDLAAENPYPTKINVTSSNSSFSISYEIELTWY